MSLLFSFCVRFALPAVVCFCFSSCWGRLFVACLPARLPGCLPARLPVRLPLLFFLLFRLVRGRGAVFLCCALCLPLPFLLLGRGFFVPSARCGGRLPSVGRWFVFCFSPGRRVACQIQRESPLVPDNRTQLCSPADGSTHPNPISIFVLEPQSMEISIESK